MEINVYCLFCAIQLNLNHRIAGQKSKNKQPSFPGLFFLGTHAANDTRNTNGQTKRVTEK